MYFRFMDDFTFGHIWCDAERWRLHCAAMAMNDAAILGRSLMSMNACYCCVLKCERSVTSGHCLLLTAMR